MADEYPLPLRGHITAVHRDIRLSVYKFRDEMLRLELEFAQLNRQQESGVATAETIAYFQTKQTSQIYSRAVQVFAALAIEAFVNDYGYYRFGESGFERMVKGRTSTANKLMLACHARGVDFDEECEIAVVMKNVATRRNRLVHPKPEMQSFMPDGTIRETKERLALCDPGSAEAAVRDMEQFFRLFPQVDPEAATFFSL